MKILDAVMLLHVLDAVLLMHIFDAVKIMHRPDAVMFMHIVGAVKCCMCRQAIFAVDGSHSPSSVALWLEDENVMLI